MSLSCSQMKYIMLTMRKSDIELEVQNINNIRTTNAQVKADAGRVYADTLRAQSKALDAKSLDGGITAADTTAAQAAREAATATFNEAADKAEAVDRLWENQLKQLETEHKCVETEIDAVKKTIDKSVEAGYKTLA